MRDLILMATPVASFLYLIMHPQEIAAIARFLEGLLRWCLRVAGMQHAGEPHLSCWRYSATSHSNELQEPSIVFL